ncbi:MAG: energy transducer TonB [Burkholderiales bacterium]
MKRLIPVIVLAAGCAVVPQPDAPGGPDPRVEPVPRLPAEAAEARSLEEYKQQVAHAILHANAEHTFIGRLPEVLKSVVVLQVEIDRLGFPYAVRLFRSNGYKDLEARAIQSVRAGSLPKPGGAVTGGHGYVSFTETWLFRDDGKFQIRTLAGPQ